MSLALARDPSGRGAAAAALSSALPAEAERASPDPVTSHGIRLAALPLEGVVRGDAAAADVWQATPDARRSLRIDVAFDAARALERSGRADDAAKAYRLAATPASLKLDALVVVLAHLGIARAERALGHADVADREEALVRRAWAHADPDVLARAFRAD